jgi:hypothetical protein
MKHALLPEASTSNICSERVDHAEYYNSLDWTGYETKCQGLRVVFIPSLNVEGEEC